MASSEAIAMLCRKTLLTEKETLKRKCDPWSRSAEQVRKEKDHKRTHSGLGGECVCEKNANTYAEI